MEKEKKSRNICQGRESRTRGITLNDNKLLWHYSTLGVITEEVYTNIVGAIHLQEEVALKKEKDSPHEYFWVITKEKVKYLLSTDLVGELPLKITKTEKIPFQTKVYNLITEFAPVKIKQEKNYTFRELVDILLPLGHSSPEDFLLYKIIGLAAYLDRINVRVASEMGFGKDSVFNILRALRNDVSIVTPSSTASIEYRLTNKVVVINETSNLASEQKSLVQQILLRTGDLSNNYEKSTRGSSTHGTMDNYDISKLSILVVYNNLDYYEKVGQGDKFFDKMFTPAVKDRFFPVKLEGQLDISAFNKNADLNAISMRQLALDNKDFYLSIIRTIEYYKFNYSKELKQYKDNTEIAGRQGHTFEVIKMFFNLYANTQKEYDDLVNLLIAKNKDYLKMVGVNKTGIKVTKESSEKQKSLLGSNEYMEFIDENKGKVKMKDFIARFGEKAINDIICLEEYSINGDYIIKN